MSFKQSDITQMTQEEKQLLLKDLCGRLPYGVNIQLYYDEMDGSGYFDERVWEVDNAEPFHVNDWGIEHIKPYLRPMSSMTEKEIEEYWTKINNDAPEMPIDEIPSIENIAKCSEVVLDFLNSHYLDYRGLIPMGLALEAPKDMYNI